MHNDLSKSLKLLLSIGYRFLFFLIFTLSSSLYSLSAMLKESMYKAKDKKKNLSSLGDWNRISAFQDFPFGDMSRFIVILPFRKKAVK